MSEWRSTTLGDVLTLQRGFDITRAAQEPGEVPVVSSGGVASYHNVAAADGPGVVIGRKGTLGTVFYLDRDYWPHDTTLWVKDFKGSLPRFVYYFLKTLDFGRHDVGSSNPTLNRNHVHPLPVWFPSRAVQESIAAVLGALDDKIAVNEQIAAKSRELAVAQFSRALMSGAEYARLSTLTGVLVRGVAAKYVENDGVAILNQRCIRDGRVSTESARLTLADKVPSSKMLQPDDVLVNSTGVGTLGRVARWTSAVEATVDSHVTIVRFARDAIDPLVGGFAMLLAEARIADMGEGSTGQIELSRSKLGELEILLPDDKTVATSLRPLERLGDQALMENRALAELRDTLLPKLMSGELRIKDAERQVADAV